MGNSASVQSFTTDQNQLIQELNGIALELTETYNNKFLDPKFCTSVALIYTDRLSHYRKQTLNGVALDLGVVADVPQLKQNLCEVIVKHYTDRLNLIAAIQSSISFCSDRIFALVTGPRCEGNPEIFDQPECVKSGGRWVNTVVPPDEALDANAQWFNYVKNMQSKYLDTLQRLIDILKQLKNFDESIKDEELREIGHETKRLIEEMHQNCSNLYKLSLTTPTFTTAELRAIQHEQNISQQEAAAHAAALRASRGLPPVGQAGGGKKQHNKKK